jgi:hypothetical protein
MPCIIDVGDVHGRVNGLIDIGLQHVRRVQALKYERRKISAKLEIWKVNRWDKDFTSKSWTKIAIFIS